MDTIPEWFLQVSDRPYFQDEDCAVFLFADRDSAPSFAGIYFAEANGEILYIGQSENIAKRMKGHSRAKVFLSAGAVIRCFRFDGTKDERIALEEQLTKIWRPILDVAPQGVETVEQAILEIAIRNAKREFESRMPTTVIDGRYEARLATTLLSVFRRVILNHIFNGGQNPEEILQSYRYWSDESWKYFWNNCTELILSAIIFADVKTEKQFKRFLEKSNIKIESSGRVDDFIARDRFINDEGTDFRAKYGRLANSLNKEFSHLDADAKAG